MNIYNDYKLFTNYNGATDLWDVTLYNVEENDATRIGMFDDNDQADKAVVLAEVMLEKGFQPEWISDKDIERLEF